MDQSHSEATSRNMHIYVTPAQENTGALTNRGGHSTSSPTKTKRSLIRINHKKLPQDFFNFGTTRIYNHQVGNKLNLSPEHSNRAEPEQKGRQYSRGIWLSNVGEQFMFGDESVIISEESDIKKIRDRLAKGLIKSHEECNSSLPPFKTTGTMTPCPSAGNESPAGDPPVFEWTFSKDMYASNSPTKQSEQKKQSPFRRRGSLKQRDLGERLLARSYDKNQGSLFSRAGDRKMVIVIPPRTGTQLPRINRK